MALMQGIRDRSRGWLAWIIVILISIPFALWGIQEYLTPDVDVAIAEVNGAEISLNEFQRVYAQRQQRMRQVFGGNLDAVIQERLRQETVDQLVDNELVMQASVQHGMRVGDNQLGSAIQSLPLFQQDGTFSQERYSRWLQSQGRTPGRFEYDFRRSLLSEQLQAGLVRSAVVTDRDAASLARLQEQKRNFSTLSVKVADLEEINVEDQAVTDYYNANKGDFITPEEIRIEYLELSRDALAESVKVEEDELRQIYETSKDNFIEPEQRRASHILVSADRDADEATESAARAKAEDLKRQLDEGASFEELAREFSEDPGSAAKGGDLGPFGRGVMDGSFEDAVFSMTVDEVSIPVRSSFGFHIIKLTEIQASKAPEFEKVRDELEANIRREKADQALSEQADELGNLVFEQRDTLADAAASLGLEVRESPFFSRDGLDADPIAAAPQVTAAAFADDVLEEGFNSELLELEGDRLVALRLKERREPRQLSEDEAREQVVVLLRERRARERVSEIGKSLLAKLRAGEEPETVAEDRELKWGAFQDVRRSAGATPEVREAAFRMPKPAPGQTVYDGITNAGGDFVIIALEAVVDELEEETPKEAADRRRLILARELGQADYVGYVQALRVGAEIVIREQSDDIY